MKRPAKRPPQRIVVIRTRARIKPEVRDIQGALAVLSEAAGWTETTVTIETAPETGRELVGGILRKRT